MRFLEYAGDFRTFMPPWNIAHRGGARLQPENTLAAFKNAVALGCDGAELDVQLTHDGEVVVFHDFRLKPDFCRDADGKWLVEQCPRIKDLTLAEIKRFDIGRADPASAYARGHEHTVWQDGLGIPTLAEVIETVKSSPKPFRLFIELKTCFSDRKVSAMPEELAKRTVEVLNAHDYLDFAIFVSFDWPGLLHIHRIEPGAECWFTTLPQSWFGAGVPPPEHDPPAQPALQVLRHWAKEGMSPWSGGYDAVHHEVSIVKAIYAAGGDGWFPFHADANEETVAEAHALGLKVGAWTVNKPEHIRALAANGLDAICSDRPDLVKANSE